MRFPLALLVLLLLLVIGCGGPRELAPTADGTRQLIVDPDAALAHAQATGYQLPAFVAVEQVADLRAHITYTSTTMRPWGEGRHIRVALIAGEPAYVITYRNDWASMTPDALDENARLPGSPFPVFEPSYLPAF